MYAIRSYYVPFGVGLFLLPAAGSISVKSVFSSHLLYLSELSAEYSVYWTSLLDRLFRVYYYFKFFPFRKERLA